MEEYWKVVKGFEHYSVSSFGNIRNEKTNKVLQPGKDTHGYYFVILSLNGKKKLHNIHRLVGNHFIENPENKRCIDHINHITTDNRVENLRWATNSENSMNTSKRNDNTSGYPGVCFDKRRNKWMARIMINGKNITIGRYPTIEQAIEARKQAEIQYFGVYANQSN